MNSKNFILLILIALLVFPVNAISPLGNVKENFGLEKSCCCVASTAHSEKKSCCSSDENQEKNDCGTDCGDNSCHCPVSISIPLFIENIAFTKKQSFSTSALGWMYLQNIPKSVSISIWQPPKIG